MSQQLTATATATIANKAVMIRDMMKPHMETQTSSFWDCGAAKSQNKALLTPSIKPTKTTPYTQFMTGSLPSTGSVNLSSLRSKAIIGLDCTVTSSRSCPSYPDEEDAKLTSVSPNTACLFFLPNAFWPLQLTCGVKRIFQFSTFQAVTIKT